MPSFREKTSAAIHLPSLATPLSRSSTKSSTNSIESLTSYEYHNPREFVEHSIKAIFTIPSDFSLEELRHEVFPKFFHENYEHRVNNRVEDMDSLCKLVERFRTLFVTMRTRIKHITMDSDGTATMGRAAVGIVYEIIAEGAHDDSDERRTTCIGVCKIKNGKMSHFDLAVDTSALKASPNELSCTIV